MRSLVIGMGQIGAAVKEVTASPFHYDVSGNTLAPAGGYDIIHICFPYSETFVEDVKEYIERFKAKHTVVWSTVPVGTCRKIGEKVVHSPVEGVHPHLVPSIRKFRRWVGFNDGMEGKFFVRYFADMGLKVWIVSDTETTELAKLRSTAKFGINVVWAEYEAELCKKFNVPYVQVMAFDQDYNALYKEFDPYMQRYVLYPPNGKIGGHCVVPNAKLLNEQYPSDLLDKIIAMEKK